MPYASYNDKSRHFGGAGMSGADPVRLRMRMVREQLEKRGISDARVLKAMSRVPRHLFVSESFAAHAYTDTPLPIGHGQTISQPFMVARMLELLALEPGMRVLEIGLGSGYQAAIMASMGCTVFGIERIRELCLLATARLRSLGLRSVSTYNGDGTLGMPLGAPFERIIVAAGAPAVPRPLAEQLADGGILLIPVRADRQGQRLLRLTKNQGKITEEDMGPAIFVNLIGDHGWKSPPRG